MRYRLAGATYRVIAEKLTEERAQAYADEKGINFERAMTRIKHVSIKTVWEDVTAEMEDLRRETEVQRSDLMALENARLDQYAGIGLIAGGVLLATCLSILGMANAASGQSLRNGFYTGLEMGRANASPLTSSVTGVNHPTRCDRLLYPASTSPPASDEACRASTPTVILRNAFDLGGGAVSGLLVGYRADRVRVEVEYLTRSQGPATAAVGATTNVALQGKDTEWSDDQPPREWIRGYAAHQIFANLYYDFPNESPWTPYVGGGLGVASTTLNYATQFIRKPDAEYLRIDFEPDWPDAAKRAAAGTLSSLDTTVRQEAFGFQVLAGADYALTEHTSVGVTGRWAQFGHITDEATWDLIRSHAPVQADGVTPFDTTQRFEGISYLAVTVGLKYYF